MIPPTFLLISALNQTNLIFSFFIINVHLFLDFQNILIRLVIYIF